MRGLEAAKYPARIQKGSRVLCSAAAAAHVCRLAAGADWRPIITRNL